MGADYVLDHSKPYTSIIKDITNNNGVDVVFEHIGPITWDNSLRVLNKGGRLVTCGSTTGSKVSIDLRYLFSKQQEIIGSTMADIDSFNSVMSKINDKVYKPFVDKVFRFKDVKNAHQYLEDRKDKESLSKIYVRSENTGKLISLSNLVDFEEKGSASKLSRYNRQRAVTISANIGESYTYQRQ